MNPGTALTGAYTVRCPYCRTHIQGRERAGAFATVGDAAKALNGHLLYTCESAPQMRQQQRERIVASQVRSVGA
jgi:hypothetical protein